MSIHVLPDEVASQIAAGEVVERPASVVKELLENALDAGATQITVSVEGAGKRLIEIADNGLGMAAVELPLAVGRHATSKLSRAEDLFHISTLGFRGEALASIGSVSRLTLTSRPSEGEVGARLLVEGGHSGETQLIGAPAGTVVRVEDLFFNVPARLKFLKQDATERQQIDGLVTRYALAYPHVRMRLLHDGRAALQTSGSGNRREVLASLYGVETARQMLAVVFQDEDIRLEGFISPLSLTRSNRREITFFINGRWVQDPSLAAALLMAYKTLLMVGRYPVAVLFISMPPELVDVNVHPAKAEVRFRHADRVFSAVQRGVKRALLAYAPIPTITPGASWASETQPRIDPAWGLAHPADEPGPDSGSEPAAGGAVRGAAASGEAASELEFASPYLGQNTMPVQQPLSGTRLPLLRLLGQVGGMYLIAEGPDGLYLIDQHAAHERVLFERMMSHTSDKPLPAQALLEPVTVQMPPAQAGLLSGQLALLGHLGFQVEPFGPSTFLVRAIPGLLAGGDPSLALRALVEDFEEDETPLQTEVEAKMVARICKRMAVKAGKLLSQEEQHALLADLEACTSPRTCPHGRPTMIHLSADLLERQFGRRGAR